MSTGGGGEFAVNRHLGHLGCPCVVADAAIARPVWGDELSQRFVGIAEVFV